MTHSTTTAQLMQRIKAGKASAQRISDLRQLKLMAENNHPDNLTPAVFDFMEAVVARYPDDPEVIQALEAASQAQFAALRADVASLLANWKGF
jgi:hypothetical protein